MGHGITSLTGKKITASPFGRRGDPSDLQPVDLGSHDEIVLVDSLDLLGAQRDGRVTPAETNIGVMAFGLGKLTDFLNKGE